jgi:hypothetical protein
LGVIRIIAEGITKLVDGFVQPLLEIYKGVLGPELLLKFLAGDNLAVPEQ